MTAHPEIALTATPTTKLVVIRSCRWWCLCISQRVFAAAAPITGVESRKEKRAAAVRSRLRKRPALMVMPLRETPGTTASACASPMDSASGAPTADMSRCWRAAFSASHISTPMAISMVPMTNGLPIDLDPTDDPTHGAQQLSFFNSHYDNACYLPMMGFVTFNDEAEQYLCAARS